MKKVISVIAAVILLTVVFCVSFNVFAADTKNGFVRENGAVYYYENDVLQTERWVKWNDNLYYINYDGKVVANDVYWVSNNNAYYFFDSKGVMQKGGFCKSVKTETYSDGSKYTYTDYFYAYSNGKLAEGWTTINGNKYYFSPYMAQGGVRYADGKYYYFTKGGVFKSGGWIKDVQTGDGWSYTTYYYAEKDGTLKQGWQTIDGKKYYFEKSEYNPYMYRNGLCKIGDYDYLFSAKGVLLAGGLQKMVYQYDDGYTWTDYFYTNKYGIPYSGWKTINGKQYYFNPAMQTSGARKINNKVYLFGKNGARITTAGWNKLTYNESYSDGTKFTYTDYYYLAGGVCKTGWQKINNKWYYFDNEAGYMYKNGGYQITKGKTTNAYVFEANGVLTKRTGWIALKSSDGKSTYKFYVLKGGIAKTGFKQWKGNYYYFNPWGYMATGVTHIENGDKVTTYFFKDNGVWVKNKAGWVKETYGANNEYSDSYYFVNGVAKVGWKVINGNSYCFDSYGRMYKGGTFNINGKDYTFRANGTLIK